MNKGEIILVTFPFTDLSGSKLRPALVLAADRDDVTVALNKIATLDYSLIMGSVGLLVENELKEVDRKLLLIFNIKDN